MNTRAVLQAIASQERFVVSSHQSIDGDGLGSMLAFDSLLRKLGKETVMVYDGALPYFYSFLPGIEEIRTYDDFSRIDRIDSWAFVSLDCSNPERLGRMDCIRRECGLVINIDHHPDNSMFGTINLVDYDIPASSLLVYDLIKTLGFTIDSAVAVQILTGFVTDTGGFQFIELNKKLLAVLDELVSAGASVVTIMRYAFKYRRPEALRLLGRALNNLVYYPEFNCSITHLSREDYLACEAFEEDSEGIVDYGLHVREAEISLFIKELEPGRSKVSLRSQGKINILPIAHHFGGGGHFKAAGFRMEGSLSQTQTRLLSYFEEFFSTRKQAGTVESGR